MSEQKQQPDDLKALETLSRARAAIIKALSRVVVGQTQVIDEMLTVFFAGGHLLLVGVPGLAKTLLVRTLAGTLSLEFRRIQFTPDLMPSDITGIEVFREDRATGNRELTFVPGPVFGNIILADEINRTPPKTQAALLEAMQELQVTAGGKRYPLAPPFMVMATQNPIEQEGTYPLPEAQLDRFMFETRIDYPSEDEELEIILRTTAEEEPAIEPILSATEIKALQRLVRRIPAPEHTARLAMFLARGSRPAEDNPHAFVNQYVTWGAGPRGAKHLLLAAKSHAALNGRECVSLEDVRAVALPALRHRIMMNYDAEMEGVRSDDIVPRLLEAAEVEANRQIAFLKSSPSPPGGP